MKSIKEIKKQQRDELIKLVEWVGSQARLARELNTSNQVVYSWVKRGRISATAAMMVEKKTDGLFTKESLRPDVTAWG